MRRTEEQAHTQTSLDEKEAAAQPYNLLAGAVCPCSSPPAPHHTPLDAGTRNSCPYQAGTLCAFAVPPRTVQHTITYQCRQQSAMADRFQTATTGASTLPNCVVSTQPPASDHHCQSKHPTPMCGEHQAAMAEGISQAGPVSITRYHS